MDATDARHRGVVAAAWHDYGDARGIVDVAELTAMVSTNRVYRLTLEDGTWVIAKSSNYGSFFLFAEDHDRLNRVNQLLRSSPYERLPGRRLHPRRRAVHLVRRRDVGDLLPLHRGPRSPARASSPISRSHASAASWPASTGPAPAIVAADPGAVEDGQVRRRQPLRDDGRPQRRPGARARPEPRRPRAPAHPPVPDVGVRVGVRRLAEDPGADRLEPRQLLGRSPTRTTATRSGCSAAGTTTGSGSSRGCSTSTSCPGCRHAPVIARRSRTRATPCSSRGSSGSCAPTTPSTRSPRRRCCSSRRRTASSC